jgi:ubiquinone biosynthesis O-methyltransferase
VGERWEAEESGGKSFRAACYLSARPYARGRSVLDVGCGAGFGANLLAEVAAQVTGIDYSAEAIDYARSHYSRQNISFMVMDAQHLEFNTDFDLAVCFEVLEHVREPEHILRGIRSVLKRNSKVVISTPNSDWERLDHVGLGFLNEHHVHVMERDELERSFRGRLVKRKYLIPASMWCFPVPDRPPKRVVSP